MDTQRRSLVLAGLSLPLAGGARPAPVRLLVGAPPGGATDTLARTLASDLGRLLGRTVVVENRTGAGGNLAAEAVAKSAPDGNTLLLSFTSHAINASLYPQLPFDPVRDFTPLTCVATSPSVLVAPRSLPAFPNVPAIGEVLPGYESSAWFGLFGPAHMSTDLTARISAAARLAIASPEVRRRIEAEGALPVGNAPEVFGPFVQREIQRWAKVVKYSGARPE